MNKAKRVIKLCEVDYSNQPSEDLKAVLKHMVALSK